MRLRYIKEPGQATELLVDGNVLEVTAEIGRMIQRIWYGMGETDRAMFKRAVQIVIVDESPVWSASEGITVNASELLRQAKEAEP